MWFFFLAIYLLILCRCCRVAETAENIGYSCNLLQEEMTDVFVVSGNSSDDVRQELRSEEVLFVIIQIMTEQLSFSHADYETSLCFHPCFIPLWSRNARSSMKLDVVEDSVFLTERTLGKSAKVVTDEVANGEYGLVINGHSLVRLEVSSLQCTVMQYVCWCSR